MRNEQQIEQAKAILKNAGYYVDNLWSVHDVQDKYECDDDTAQEILHSAMTHEGVIERIFDVIESDIEYFIKEQNKQ